MVLLSEINASLARLSFACADLCCLSRRSSLSHCAGVSLWPFALAVFCAFCLALSKPLYHFDVFGMVRLMKLMLCVCRWYRFMSFVFVADIDLWAVLLHQCGFMLVVLFVFVPKVLSRYNFIWGWLSILNRVWLVYFDVGLGALLAFVWLNLFLLEFIYSGFGDRFWSQSTTVVRLALLPPSL